MNKASLFCLCIAIILLSHTSVFSMDGIPTGPAVDYEKKMNEHVKRYTRELIRKLRAEIERGKEATFTKAPT